MLSAESQESPAETCIGCPSCREDLPVRLTRTGESAALWKCASCNYPIAGVCVPPLFAQLCGRVVLSETYFDTSAAEPISQAMRHAALQLAQRTQSMPQHAARRSSREAKIKVVQAVSLSSGLNPIGDSLNVMMANVARDGIGLVHTQELMHRYLALQLPPVGDKRIQVILELIRQHPIQGGFVEIGGQLVFRLGASAS